MRRCRWISSAVLGKNKMTPAEDITPGGRLDTLGVNESQENESMKLRKEGFTTQFIGKGRGRGSWAPEDKNT